MISYELKYLKYKKKYLELKTKFADVTFDDLKSKITYSQTYCTDPQNYFHQHAGECWSDAIQMIICFSDELKSSVQSKLYNLTPEEIVQMAYLANRNKYLPSIYRRSDAEKETHLVSKFEERLVKYLTMLQNRLCLHVINEGMDKKIINQCVKIDADSDTCPIIRTYSKFLISEQKKDTKDTKDTNNSDKKETDEVSKLKLHRQKSEILGIGSAIYGLKVANVKKKVDDSKHGARMYEMFPIINALSYCLLDEQFVLKTKYITINELTKQIIDESFGAIVITPEHGTAFYICNKQQIYYDDNYGIFLLNWKKILTEYLCYIDTHFLHLYYKSNKYLPIYKHKTTKKLFVMKTDGLKQIPKVDFFEFKKSRVEAFITISKVDIKDKNDDEIYSVLENQFVVANLLNNSIENIKNPMTNFAHITPIHYVALNMNIRFFKQMIESIRDFNFSEDEEIKITLFDSLDKRKFEVIEYLVPKYLPIDIKDEDDKTLLIRIITQKTSTKKYDAVAECDELKIIDYLIKNDSDSGLSYKLNEYTAFEHALIKRKINAIKIFVNNKYNINLPNYKNETPFIFLSKRKNMTEKDLDIIKFLIKSGVDVNQKDDNGFTVLQYLSSKYIQSKIEKELIKTIKLHILSSKTYTIAQKKYIDLIINSNEDSSVINTLNRMDIIRLFNDTRDFNIENIDISNEMKKVFFTFNIMLVELNEQTIINILPYLHKINFSEYCPLITEKYNFILNKILCIHENNSLVFKNIASYFNIENELLFELFTKLNKKEAYEAFVSRMSKDSRFLENALTDVNFKNKEKIVYFFKKVRNTNLKIYSFGQDICEKIITLIINTFFLNKDKIIAEQAIYDEEHKKLSSTVAKQIDKYNNVRSCFLKIKKNIKTRAIKINNYDFDVNKTLVKTHEKNERIKKQIPKTIVIEKKIVEDDYNKINDIKTKIKTIITTNPDSIVLSEEDIEIMGKSGREADPIVFVAHGSLTGTYFYLDNINTSIYTMTQAGTILYASSYSVEDELISKIKNVVCEPYEKIIETMETHLKEISVESDKYNPEMFPIKSRINLQKVKKHVKSTDKKYIMNDMYINFHDDIKNVYAYNLINEAKKKTSLAMKEEDFNKKKNPDLYIPPSFLAINAEKKKFLLSDLINFFGERPYVLFNCRAKRIDKLETDYLSKIYEFNNKLYIQPILTRQISNLDSSDAQEDIETHKFLLKYINI